MSILLEQATQAEIAYVPSDDFYKQEDLPFVFWRDREYLAQVD